MTTIDKLSSEHVNGRLVERADRTRTTQLAHHLSSVALRQAERALTGVIALPAAVALGIAAISTFGVAMTERVFEVLESAIGEIGRSVAQVDGQHRLFGQDRGSSEARV
jgi:hypothetical protein